MSKINKSGPIPSHCPEIGECWLWTGGIDQGYGHTWIHGAKHGAHRVAYAIANGGVPTEMLCCHKCDNPICVRHDHIFLGTTMDNMADCVAKGRNVKGMRHWQHTHPHLKKTGDSHYARLRPELLARGDRNGARLYPERMRRVDPVYLPRGEAHYCSKITAEMVPRIRELFDLKTLTAVAIAKELNVTAVTVRSVGYRCCWRHVPEKDGTMPVPRHPKKR